MFDQFAGPAGVTLPVSLLNAVPLTGLRAAVAQHTYSSAYSRLPCVGRASAATFAFYGVVCASALLDTIDRDIAAARIASFKPFQSLPFEVAGAVLTLAESYNAWLAAAGWTDAQRLEALKGMACALMAVAHEAQRAQTKHHVDPAPVIMPAGFPRLVNELVFGIGVTPIVDSGAASGPSCEDVSRDDGPREGLGSANDQDVPSAPIALDDMSPFHQEHGDQHEPSAAALVPISKAIDDWVRARQLSRSEASRQTTSARQFAQWLELATAPVSQLALIGTDASWMFHNQDHTLAPRGQRGRIKHVRDFLNYVRALGVHVPNQISGGESEEATDA